MLQLDCFFKVLVKCKCGNLSEKVTCNLGGDMRDSEYQK